ncbi:MAG TPA: YsnF/AvaK domain-containing protein [Nitrococcus sp.]|nr:YsnF/AvaK domain-containing protein [Nitrococcus sp.]
MRRALVAVYDKQADAQRALDALLDKGFSHDNARLTSLESVDMASSANESADREESLGDKIGKLFGFDKVDDNRTYSEAVRRGHGVLTVDVNDNEAKYAEEIMEQYHPMEIEERAAQWRESDRQAKQVDTQATHQITGQPTDEEIVIPIVEEQIRVGKREAQHGHTRIRSHTYSIPVEESVQLHEQHTDISRRPADRPVTEEDRRLGETELETYDTTEEPIIGKEARVVEEVVIRKKSSDQTRTVKDNVRRTDVDVERVDDDGKTTSEKTDRERR